MTITLEQAILAGVWAVCLVGLVLVPKSKRREAQAVFLFQQLLSWILGLIVVEKDWLEYPVRELQSSRTSFTFEFLAYPTIATYLNLYFPKLKSGLVRAGYTLAYPAAMTGVEYFIEKYTDLISYNSWKWYWTFLSVWLTLLLSRLFCTWFMKEFRDYPHKSPS